MVFETQTNAAAGIFWFSQHSEKHAHTHHILNSTPLFIYLVNKHQLLTLGLQVHNGFPSQIYASSRQQSQTRHCDGISSCR